MKELKERVLAFALKYHDFESFIEKLTEASTLQEVWDVIMEYQWLLSHRGFDAGKMPDEITHVNGSLDLTGYAHPLPEGFTHCGGILSLRGYSHPLPKGLKINDKKHNNMENKKFTENDYIFLLTLLDRAEDVLRKAKQITEDEDNDPISEATRIGCNILFCDIIRTLYGQIEDNGNALR